MPSDETRFLYELEIEVEAELELSKSSRTGDELAESPAEWLYDPADVEREQVGLTNLLEAAEALGADGEIELSPGGDERR